MKRFTPYLLALLPCFGALILAVSADEDQETGQATLLVKVAPEKIGEVVAAVKTAGGTVYNTDTMKLLWAPNIPQQPTYVQIADVTPLVGAVRHAEDAVRSQDPGFLVDRLDVQQRRLRVTVKAADAKVLDAFGAALASLADPMGFTVDAVERGSTSRIGSGPLRSDFLLRLTPKPFDGPAPALFDPKASAISMSEVQELARAASLEMVTAGPERVEANKSAKSMISSREFTWAPCTRAQLEAFIKSVQELEGLTVVELRMRIEDKKYDGEGAPLLRKPFVKIATVRRMSR